MSERRRRRNIMTVTSRALCLHTITRKPDRKRPMVSWSIWGNPIKPGSTTHQRGRLSVPYQRITQHRLFVPGIDLVDRESPLFVVPKCIAIVSAIERR